MKSHKSITVAVLIFLGIVLSTGITVFSYNRSVKLNPRSDFYVFWNAGHSYSVGDDLYRQADDQRRFFYPPFAAFLFQVLAVMNFRTSAFVFGCFNYFILFPLTIWMLVKICRNYGFKDRAGLAVALACICSFHYFWSNLIMFQMNLLVFTLCVAGIYFFSRKQSHWASLFLVAATFIKVYPVFLLAFVFITSLKSGKTILYTTGGILACLLISIIPRGFETGLNDYISYYFSFLKEFQEGRIITIDANHTFKAFILKAFYPETRNVDIIASDYSLAVRIAEIILLLLFVSVIISSWKVIKSGSREKILIIFSLVFIFTHLFSGITWTAHLVTAMFSFLPLFLIDRKKIEGKTHRIVYFLLAGMAFLLAIEGKDTTGRWLYYNLRHYDIFVIYPLVLFIYYTFIVAGKNSDLFFCNIPKIKTADENTEVTQGQGVD